MGVESGGAGRAASVSLGRWLGAFFLRHKPSAQRGLAFPEIREDRFYVKVVFPREFFACPVDVRDDGVFPHDIKFP
jgi:hypothetical protein